MKIIISPAKKMRICTEEPFVPKKPEQIEDAKYLRDLLKQKKPEELKDLWNCNEKIAHENFRRLQELDPEKNLTPALLAYEGIQYQYMAPQVFTEDQWEYANRHVRILSGMYGILAPEDGVIPYRLEMQARLSNRKGKNLYEFWGRKLYEKLTEQDNIIVNLASKEYSKIVEKYLEKEIRFITCVFGERKDEKVRIKATQAKMARGEMVRWMAENQIEFPEQLRDFSCLDYIFEEELSSEETYVFLKKKETIWNTEKRL